jgi:hypothetical protein
MAVGVGQRVESGKRERIQIEKIGSIQAGFSTSFTVNGNQIDAWFDESINGNDATPPATSPQHGEYEFSGYRGILLSKPLDLDSVAVLTRPYEVWFSVNANTLPANQRIVQSADEATDHFSILTTGAVRARINNGNRDLTPTSTIAADTIYTIGIICDADGNLTCDVNGTLFDESQTNAATVDIARIGIDSVNQDIYIGALYIYDDELTTSERNAVKKKLDKRRHGTFAAIGMSNTWDAIQGYKDYVAGIHSFHSASGYNNNAMKDWFDNIGNTGIPPWSTFQNELNGHGFVNRIWFHMGIAVADAATPDGTVQTWATDILAEARSLMNTAGHDGTNAVCYASPFAVYDPLVDCAILSSGAWQKAFDVYTWAIGGGLTNCVTGPILPEIDTVRADGVVTSECHVAEAYKINDGAALKRFFDNL